MNKDRLARATFVLERETNDQLARIARKFGVSRSTLVQDVLAEPVTMMAKWTDAVPSNPTPEDTAALFVGMQTDLESFIESEIRKLSHG